MAAYTNGSVEKMVWNNPSMTETKDLKAQMEHMIENLKNPFDEMYHWCKGEIYDLKSLLESF